MTLLRLISETNRALCQTPLTVSRFLEIRSFAISSIAQQKSQKELSSFMPNDPGDWKSVYKFPYIKGLASANKLKMYQIVFTAAAVPVAFALPEVFDPLVVSW